MTYKELLEQLQQLPLERLEDTVTVHDPHEDEMITETAEKIQTLTAEDENWKTPENWQTVGDVIYYYYNTVKEYLYDIFLYVNDKLTKALIKDDVDPNSFLGQGGLFVAMFMLLFAYVVVEWSIGYWQFLGRIPENRISVFKWRFYWIFLIVNVLIFLFVVLP
jgi:hypothetical protein